MHRYSAAGGSSGVGNNQGSGASSREIRGSDSSFTSASSFALPSRRAGQLVPYKLKCEREPLSARFGPPDFYPPAPNCPEEVLNRDSCVNGYKELIDGIEEAHEAKLSLTSPTYNNLWNKQSVNRYKEAIRKRLRALNNALIRKRKAGQIYGVPLVGPLLGKPGLFPELRTCGEDFRKKWIEDLSQRKRLRNLAEHVPHGYRRRALFEALIRHDVPLLRATWFVKIMYLNQVKPMSIGMSAGGPDKSQAKRVELWTKDVLEYAQSLLDELCQVSSAARQISMSHVGMGNQHLGGDPGQGSVDAAEPELQTKWRYVVRLAQWHHAEGLIHRTQLVDWVLKQLHEKDSIEALELLLPVILKLIDEISSSQTHVRVLVDIVLHWLKELCPSGVSPNLVDRPHLLYSAITLTELLRYLLLMVPDTFVALDCFPLPSCVCPEQPREDVPRFPVSIRDVETKEFQHLRRLSESGEDRKDPGRKEDVPNSCNTGKLLSDRELVVDVVDGIQKRAASLAKAVNPGLLRNNEGKVVQGLDKALMAGDIRGACNCVFDEDFCSSDQLPDEWQADVIAGFGRTPSLLSNVHMSELFAIRFLCEWAVCEFRDTRGAPSTSDRTSTAVRDMSRIYMAVSVLHLRMQELNERRMTSDALSCRVEKIDSRLSNGELNAQATSHRRRGQNRDGYTSNTSECLRSQAPVLMVARQSGPGFCASPGPLHDLIVAWLDQHELWKGESSERLQLLLSELVRKGLFWPDAYVRQLLCSGVLERNKTAVDIGRAARHKLLLQHLPGPPHLEGCVDSTMLEAARLYQNERYLALHGFNTRKVKHGETKFGGPAAIAQQHPDGVVSRADAWGNNGSEHRLGFGTPENRVRGVKKNRKVRVKLVELKQAIASCFQFPDGYVGQLGVDSERKNNRSLERQAASPSSMVKTESTPGCEECSRSKRLKLNDGKGWNAQLLVPAPPDEDETWWLRKGQKALDAVKVEPLVKPAAKQTTRGRPKAVRKTQSLAQLAAARIEGSQGASSSHTCDTKVNCPYHRSTTEGRSSSQNRDRTKELSGNNVRAIGNAIRGLRLNEKRSLCCWLDNVVRSLLSGGGNGSPNPFNNVVSGVLTNVPLTAGDGSAARWKINEDQLAIMVFILDLAHDYHTLVQLLLWLLPMAPTLHTSGPGHGSRGISTPAWNRENSICEVGEGALLSYLRRYEGMLAAMDLLPQALLAGMHRAANLMAVVPGGRAVCSALLCYVRDLLRKYGGLESVQMWEKNWKATCDQRLVAELEALKAGDSEGGFSLVGSGVSDERDDPIPQRLTGRLARVGANMKDIIQRGMNDAATQIINKERDLAPSGALRDGVVDRFEEGQQTVQRVVVGVMDAIRQNGSGAPQGDSSLVATVVSLVVASAGNTIANIFETLGASHHMGLGTSGLDSSVKCARQVLQMHILCLRLLKESLGDRHSRMLEVALATEANSVVIQAMQHPPGRAPRAQFHLSLENPENPALANDFGAGVNILGRSNISAAAVASLVAGVAVQGITSLERMITVLKIRENLDSLQITKTGSTNANSISRSATGTSNLKDHVAEAHVYWFRVLIGDCSTVAGGLVADLLGDANVLGLARMQRLMPLTTVFSPAYALFAAALRRQPLAYLNSTVRDDPVVHAAVNAVNEVVAHEPFRDVCLRDTRALYLLLSSDSGESEYAAMLDLQGLDVFSKVVSMVPLRARLFLHSLLDRSLPPCLLQEDEAWGQGRMDPKNRFANEPRQIEQLVQVLDDLQPGTYHWQWVELRLLLNEQVFIEKLEGQNMTGVEAVHAAAAAGSDSRQLSECEKTFTEVVLTRLLVRPDAAALYSEAVHCLGRALEEYLILQVKWVLENNDMLLGRKSLHQLLDDIATRRGFAIGMQRVKIWGWRPARHGVNSGSALSSGEKKGSEVPSPEEGEVADDGGDFMKDSRQYRKGIPGTEQEVLQSQQFTTEKALADLVLPCLARSSNDTCSSFAFDLIKQMSTLEQQITLLARSTAKPVTVSASATGSEALGGKSSGLRRGARGGLEGGSPGIGRKFMGLTPDSLPVSAAALQTSMWLRLQFLLPLLPIIHTDREQTARNMRQTLAPVLLRLLGTRVVQEAVESLHTVPARDLSRNVEASSVAATAAAGEGLFDCLLSVLHALLSSTWAVWLKPRSTTKGPSKPLREVPPFDREAAERMQAELEHMQLPRSVRARLQAALPLLPLPPSLTISAGPPQLPLSALSLINSGNSSSLLSAAFSPSGAVQKTSFSFDTNLGKVKPSFFSEPEVEVDPWTLLEDGVGSGSGEVVSGEVGNLKACYWLKGAMRVRRSDLTYVGAVDEDS